MLHIEIIESICKHYGKVPGDVAKKGHGQAPMLTYGDVLSRILTGAGSSTQDVFPEMSRPAITKVLNNCFPGKTGSKVRWLTYLLDILELKSCSGCASIMSVSNFHSNPTCISGLSNTCKTCASNRGQQYRAGNPEYHSQYRLDNKEALKDYDRQYRIGHLEARAASNAKYRAAKLQAVPAWTNHEEVSLIYLYCPEGSHVDHIIPLQGELVCGLHCEHNLQYLPAHENISKSNKFSTEAHLHTVEYVAPYK